MTLKNAPIVKAQMLIRKPVKDVFEAFVNPAITTKFWFTRSSGKLEAGKEVRWEWEMYGVSAQVRVKALLEHNVALNLVADHYPDAHKQRSA